MPARLTDRSETLTSLRPVIRRTLVVAGVPSGAVDDAEQCTLLALAPHAAKLRAMEPPLRVTYAYKAALRIGIRARRLPSGQPVGDEWIVDVPDPALRADDALVRDQQARRVAAAVARLDARERAVIDRMFDGLSEREVAAQLGLSRGAVAHRLRSVRDALGRAWAGTTSWARRRGASR